MEINESIEKEAKRRNYSLRTIQIYKYCTSRFFKYCKKDPKKVTKKDVRDFLDEINKKGRSGNTIHVYLNSLKFVFEDLLGKKMKLNIRYPKRPLKCPEFLYKEEVNQLLDSIANKKHKLMVSFLYSAGLRVSELTNMKVKDLELNKNYGFVRQGKGRKDRVFIIAEGLKDEVKKLIQAEKLELEGFLFSSNRKKPYSTRSLQEILKNAAKKSGIKKKVHPHMLRHSFGTHLIMDGYSLTEVQALLGHKSPETSMIYVHMASPNLINVRSPFDSLEEDKKRRYEYKN